MRWAVALLCLAVPATRARAQQPVAPSTALLQSGDKVQLKIWREPDLSGEFVVAEDGAVVFPKVGRVQVNKLSVDSLRNLLISEYSVSLRDPAIEITALRRVSVVGAVRNPGFYYADPTITVNGAVALAGGVTPDGNRNRIDLTRQGRETDIDLNHQRALADSSIASGDQIRVPERSWASRNTALVASLITGAAIVAAAVIRP